MIRCVMRMSSDKSEPVELRRLRHATVLARQGSFARAAQFLGLTQPSLSRSIAALERSVAMPLFDRGRGGVWPTPAGQLLLGRSEALLAGEADLRRELALLAGLAAGRVDVVCGPYPLEISVGPALRRLLADHPALAVSVVASDGDDITRDVLAGRVDLAVIGPYVIGRADAFDVEPLATHRLVFACRPGHPLEGRRGLRLDQVLQFPFAGPIAAGPAARVAGSGGRAGRYDAAGGRFVPAVHVTSLWLARQMAAASDALTLATEAMLRDDLAAGRLAVVDFHVPAMEVRYAIVTRRGRSLSPAAQAFVARLRAVEAETAAPAGRRARRPNPRTIESERDSRR
jgi:DNA-binding transcriptional LysR family regulator